MRLITRHFWPRRRLQVACRTNLIGCLAAQCSQPANAQLQAQLEAAVASMHAHIDAHNAEVHL